MRLGPLADLIALRLTTIVQPAGRIAKAAVSAALGADPQESILFPGEFALRDSEGPPPIFASRRPNPKAIEIRARKPKLLEPEEGRRPRRRSLPPATCPIVSTRRATSLSKTEIGSDVEGGRLAGDSPPAWRSALEHSGGAKFRGRLTGLDAPATSLRVLP